MPNIQTFDYSVDLDQVLLWQHNNAARLQSLIHQKEAWYAANQSDFWSNWYRDVFNLQTANDFGLAVWAIILDVPLVANATSGAFRQTFGFQPYSLNFLNSNFAPDPNSSLSLTTEEKRLILKLRYFQLISSGCPFEINDMLAYVFKDMGPVYVLDGLDMTAEYVFGFIPSPKITFVLGNFDILPRPAGVKVSILVNPRDSFGFDPYYLNFHASNFSGGG